MLCIIKIKIKHNGLTVPCLSIKPINTRNIFDAHVGTTRLVLNSNYLLDLKYYIHASIHN